MWTVHTKPPTPSCMHCMFVQYCMHVHHCMNCGLWTMWTISFKLVPTNLFLTPESARRVCGQCGQFGHPIKFAVPLVAYFLSTCFFLSFHLIVHIVHKQLKPA